MTKSTKSNRTLTVTIPRSPKSKSKSSGIAKCIPVPVAPAELPPLADRHKKSVELLIAKGMDAVSIRAVFGASMSADVKKAAEAYSLSILSNRTRVHDLVCEHIRTKKDAVMKRIKKELQATELEQHKEAMAGFHIGDGPKIDTPAPVKEDKPAPVKEDKPARTLLFGHPVTAIMRWLGAHDYTHAYSHSLLTDLLPSPPNPATLKIQMTAGRKNDGSRGPVPVLCRKDIKTLTKKS